MKKSTAVGLGIFGAGMLWWGLANAKTPPKAQAPAPRPPAPPPRPQPPAPIPIVAANTPPAPPVVFNTDPVVLYVQLALNSQGYGPLSEDGNWGPLTSKAVAKYQGVNALDTTGTITEDLLDSLQTTAPTLQRPMGPPPPTRAL